jgi:hypothetical protein
MSNASYIDINGVYDTEKNFLDNIRNQPNIDPNKINQIQQKLETAHKTLNNSKTTSSHVLTEQHKMLNIVNTEKHRLDQKKQTIKNALDGQKRLITLNESYRLRNNDYTIMLASCVICLAILFGLTIISNNFPVIPSIVFDILFSIIIAITLYILYNKYLNILSHDRIYYNEINLDSPQILTPEQIAKQTADAQQKAINSPKADLLSTINIGGCVGPLCCSGESYWDADKSICTTKTATSGFTTLNLAYGNGELLLKPTITDGISPNSPNEFVRYGKI